MARKDKIDPELSRKAYAAAVKALKETYAKEFAANLDKAYADLGVESPRLRSIRLQGEASAKRKAAAERREERRLAKIEELKGQLALLETPAV